ncbi:MAG TPA: transposase [Terriglobales bacterium]|nr:transposase [Terriglobales bacterium]
MPKGLKRFYGNGDLHFITASCYRREPLLGTAYRKDLFVKVLEQVRQRYEFVVVGYVVMPEHFHLLISEPTRANPSVVIQALKLGVVRCVFPLLSKPGRSGATSSYLVISALRNIFGRDAFTTSMYGARTNIARSCVIYIAIPSNAGWLKLPISGGGAAFELTLLVKPGLWSSMTGLY